MIGRKSEKSVTLPLCCNLASRLHDEMKLVGQLVNQSKFHCN